MFLLQTYKHLFLICLFYKQTFDGLRFEWDEYEQNIILGSFFWGYVMTELPGGRLAEVIGGHRVFGYSMLSASVLTLLTPLAARLGYVFVVVLRVLLGLMLVINKMLNMCAQRNSCGAFTLLLPLDFKFVNTLSQAAQVVMGDFLFRQNIIFDLCKWHQCHQS
jgi:MFS family permease